MEQREELMEERQEIIMVPCVSRLSTSRKTHFLKPIVTRLESLPSNNSSHSVVQNLKRGTFKVNMKGGFPQKNWKKWVHEMSPLHQHAWKKAGIFEAILTSTYKIKKHKKLVMALAERWGVETNTFVFAWGEATITLEDLMVLGGYSVLGKPVFDPLDTDDLRTTYKNIKENCTGKIGGSYYAWLEYFMGKGGEVEHVAFLILWLSRYVLPSKLNIVAMHVFPIAVHLSKGVQIALGPAVLASIYNDLSLLKRLMVGISKKNGCEFEKENVKISVWSPLHFVQLWAWERFPKLRPNTCSIKYGEPRLARWDTLGKFEVENVSELMDRSGESFQWRPYAIPSGNWEFNKWYKANEMYVLVDFEMEMDDVEEFVRFVRVSELVGLDCIEHYAPHRVARQFGLDQDVPGCVDRHNETAQMAWSYYNRPITSAFVYIPPKIFEAGVSTRYYKWWYQEKMGAKDLPKKCRKVSEVYCMKEESNHTLDIQNLGSSIDIRTTEERLKIGLISRDEEDGVSISKVHSSGKKQKNSEHQLSAKILVQCGTRSTSVLKDLVTSMDPVKGFESELPSTGTPQRDIAFFNIIGTQGLSGNLDHEEGHNSNDSNVLKNGLICGSHKLGTSAEVNKNPIEDGNGAAKPESIEAANLDKSASNSKDAEMGIKNSGGSELTMKKLKSRLRNLELIKGMQF
ncbi:hypothetical protein LIER_30034 [Lithospermum erythrorhizon]|uniref:Aminotransferase-like plant mobile domain-containing protein n=1 Tax=Lithospermum erythrorhizon TaxID=34254 RepID=A0AAV3RLA8_LITER